MDLHLFDPIFLSGSKPEFRHLSEKEFLSQIATLYGSLHNLERTVPGRDSSIHYKGCRGMNMLAFALKACHNW